ncbi:MAG: HD-GYP domain-containing protein [Coriobacteriia bacterium]|nr:HD-GYP domain-containing protein [Coriobacteriia bacterium]
MSDEPRDVTPDEYPAEPREPASETLGGSVEAGEILDETTARIGMLYSARQVQRARDLLTRLYSGRRTARFYPIDHPATSDGVRALKEVIDRYHDEGVDVELAFFEGELLLGEQLLPEDSILFDQLIRELTSIGAGSLVFRQGLTFDELARAIALLAADSFEVEQNGGLQRMATEANIPHVEIGTVRVYERPEVGAEDEEAARESYTGALELVREIDALIRRNRVVSSNRVKGVVRSLVDNVLANRYAMLELAGLKNYDEYTFYHSANVAILGLALGSMVSSDYRFMSSLGTGGLLHDIGKMTVDLSILNKPGALNAEEWALVRQHPVRGAEQAAAIPGLDRSAIVIILEHHMRYDGSGYPVRTPRRLQHLSSRIVAIADAYDAMTSRRSYSAARVQDEAMGLLVQGAGAAVDATLVRMFVSMLGVYPPRSVVRLSDGSTAIVVRPSGKDMLRPVVRVIADSEGTMIESRDIDLSEDVELSIGRSLDPVLLNVDVDEYM